jgi:hypothetical protein
MKKENKINSLLLRRRQSVFVKSIKVDNKVKEKHIVALLADISQLGYTLSGEVINVLKNYDKHNLKNFHEILVATLSKMVGNNVRYIPLFKGFPEEVPDQYEYLLDRIFGYVENIIGEKPENCTTLSCGHVIDTNKFDLKMFGACPICQRQVDELNSDVKTRPVLKDVTPLKIIELVDKKEIYSIFKNLLASPISLGAEDYEDINLILSEGKKELIKENIPEITVKEILAKFAISLMKNFEADAIDLLNERKLTATDILRLAIVMSEGDVSLASQTRFKSYSNKERRFLLELLNNVVNAEVDMKRYLNSWKRLGERLHPGSYSKKYENSFKAFDLIRNNPESIETFMSLFEKAIDRKDYFGAAAILEKRPGEFVRHLDQILRNVQKEKVEEVLIMFANIIGSVKTLTLLQIQSHFSNRNKKVDQRYFMPKGNIAKIKIFDSNSEVVKLFKPISKKAINFINELIDNEIKKRYSEKEKINKVFLDLELKDCLIPSVRRNATKSLHTVARGSKLSFENKNARTVRLFIYWKGYVDLDLSVICYDQDWKEVANVSFRDLKNEDLGIIHSGDIQSAPNGATEFVDIDMDKCLNHKVKYIAMSVLSFSGQNFGEFESFAGAMTREFPNSGELYEPKTVKHRFEFDGEGRIAIPLILDIESEKIIYTDLMTSGSALFNTIEGNSTTIVLMAKSIIDFGNTKPNLYNLFRLHSEARGAIIDSVYDDEAEYDQVFSITKGLTPYDIDIINGEWID